jgi:hypothetical protein
MFFMDRNPSRLELATRCRAFGLIQHQSNPYASAKDRDQRYTSTVSASGQKRHGAAI